MARTRQQGSIASQEGRPATETQESTNTTPPTAPNLSNSFSAPNLAAAPAPISGPTAAPVPSLPATPVLHAASSLVSRASTPSHALSAVHQGGRFNLRLPPANYKKRDFMHPKEPLQRNGKNFRAWKELMELALSQYPWNELITHPFSAEDLAYYSLKDDDQEVRQYIMFSIDPAIVEVLRKPRTAYLTWKALCDKFETKLNPDEAERKLNSYRIKDQGTIEEHLEQMEQLRLNYEQAGEYLEDDRWLRILKRSFENDNRPELFLDAIRSEHINVRDFEAYMKKRDEISSRMKLSVHSSNATKSLGRQKSTSNLRQCDNCKRTNHVTSQCRYVNGAQETRCANCSIFGHSKSECWRDGGGNTSNRPQNFKSKSTANTGQKALTASDMTMLQEENARLKEEVRQLRVPTDAVISSANIALMASHRLDMKGVQMVDAPCTGKGHRSSSFILDTGATTHIVADKSLFETYEPCIEVIRTADANGSMTAIGKGSIRVYSGIGNEWKTLTFQALHCPALASNLLSVSRIFDNGGSIQLAHSCATLLNSQGHSVAKGYRAGKLWLFNFVSEFDELAVLTISPRTTKRSVTLSEFHSAAAHINPATIRSAVDKGRVCGIDLKDADVSEEPCEACLEGKMTKSISPPKEPYALAVGQLLHADVVFFSSPSVSGYKMALTVQDTFSRYTWAFPLKTKDADVILQHWTYLVEFLTSHQFSVFELQTDNGSEFCNGLMEAYNKSRAITHRKSVPYAHEMNGRIERTNRTIADGTRANLFTTRMPLRFWAEALAHFLYTWNRLAVSMDQNKSPYQLVFKRTPNVGHLLPFGQPVYYFVPPELRTKLQARAKYGRVVGYDEDASYRILLPHSEIVTARDIRCLPLHSHILHSSTSPTPSLPINPGQNISNDEPVTPEPRRTTRVSKPSLKVRENTAQLAATPTNTSSQRSLPKNLSDALSGPNSKEWRDAINAENSVLQEMKVFSLRERNDTDKPLPGTLVYTRKVDDDGNERFKARYCIRGDLQVHGKDFDETFAQAGNMTGYKLVAALSMMRGAQPQALDIKGAFLTAPMDTTVVCVSLPPLYPAPGFKNPVAILNRALYGLRQAPRLFREHLVSQMRKSSYTPLQTNPALFRKSSVEGETEAVAAFWVDDGFAAQWNRALNIHAPIHDSQDGFITDVKKYFQLKVKDLALGLTIVGMHMKWDTGTNTIRLSVSEKILQLADKFGLLHANTAITPMQVDAMKIFESDTSDIDSTFPYRELIGSLLWIGTVARPDVAFAINVLSRFCDKARSSHVIAAKRVVRYLLKTKDLALIYRRPGRQVETLTGYSDADWAGDLADRKSTSGFVIMVNNAPISWKSRKQHAVAKSTAEAEYVAASECATEIQWFRAMLSELNLPSFTFSPTSMFVDNQAAIQMASNDIHMSRAKAIDIKFHHIKDMVRKGNIAIRKIAGTENPADIFTKPLPPISHYKCIEILGLA